MSNFIGFFVMTLACVIWFVGCVALGVLAGIHESFLYLGACILLFCAGMALIYCFIFAESKRLSEGKEASK